MNGLLTEEQIAEALLGFFEDQAAEQITDSAAKVTSDGTTNEVRLDGWFDLDDIAERLRTRVVVTELPQAMTEPSIGRGFIEWPVAEGYSVTACFEPRLIILGDDEHELCLHQDQALDLAARLISATAVLNHPCLVNRSPS